ncbi:hypothetical protein HDU83_004980 [Entophlyctis luteolus]|nr:hypothetical protein HDU83_004980 [Entophlyctis luteolus]
MGISGLLPLLAPISRPVHLRDLAGAHFPLRPITVVSLSLTAFSRASDCCRCICLAASRRRTESREKALQEISHGNKAKAMELFQQSVDITPNMALELIKILRQKNIEFVVAPYEADAQLTYLEKINYVDAILTEDSDLLVFGSQRVIFKLDATGNAVEILATDFPKLKLMKRGWSFERFREACILSGCDYLPSLKGVGLKKALDAVALTGSAEKTLRMWKTLGRTMNAPPWRKDYDLDFQEAEFTFLYQRVYDPDKKYLVHLNTPSGMSTSDLKDMARFLGPEISPEKAEGIATGFLNPFTLKPYSNDDSYDFDEDRHNSVTAERIQCSKPNATVFQADLSSSTKILHLSVGSSQQPKFMLRATESASRFFQSHSRVKEHCHEPDEQPRPSISPNRRKQPLSERASAETNVTSSVNLSRFQSKESCDGFSYHHSIVKKVTAPITIDNEADLHIEKISDFGCSTKRQKFETVDGCDGKIESMDGPSMVSDAIYLEWSSKSSDEKR